MSEQFDNLSRTLAGASSRRGVLKMIGAAAAAATAATVLRPFRAHGLVACKPGLVHCGTDGCCPAGTGCIDPSTGKCGCDPANNIICGTGCCKKKETCSDPASVTCCCKGQTPCGTSCCKGGVTCLSREQGLCGCPPGTTPCGSATNLRCCPAGKACTPNSECPPATTGQATGAGYATPCSNPCAKPCCSSLGCDNSGEICVAGCCTACRRCETNAGCSQGEICNTNGCCQPCTSCSEGANGDSFCRQALGTSTALCGHFGLNFSGPFCCVCKGGRGSVTP